MHLVGIRRLVWVCCVGGALIAVSLLYPIVVRTFWKWLPSADSRQTRTEPDSIERQLVRANLPLQDSRQPAASSLTQAHVPTVTSVIDVDPMCSATDCPQTSLKKANASTGWRPSLLAMTSNKTADTPVTFLCVDFNGRLGNEMFEYASVMGLALTLNRIPVFWKSKILPLVLQRFSISPSNLSTWQLAERCRKGRRAKEDSCCRYSPHLANLDPDHDYYLGTGTYLQSYRYFISHEHRVRQALVFNQDVRQESERIVHYLRRTYNSSTLVGMHIRHGDMASAGGRRFGYPAASTPYMNRSMSFFTGLYPDSVFVVATDSPEWCRTSIPSGFQVHFLASQAPAVHMQILISLDHVITSFGTYSWWVGYLNQGKTVYMKDFLIPGTPFAKKFRPEGKDYIYPDWIGV